MDTRIQTILDYDDVRAMVRGYAASSLGQALASRMRPATDPAVVMARLAETTEAVRLFGDVGDMPLGGLHDVHDTVRRAQKHGVLTAQELLDIAETAACCRRVRRFLQRAGDAFPRLWAQGMILGEFSAVEDAVDRAISDRGEVRDSASTELERARRRVRVLHDELQRDLQHVLGAPELQEPIITQRNGRFCVPVRAECRNSFRGIVHDISASGQTVFMEPMSVVERGNDLREAERLEEEEVHRVLAALSEKVGGVAARLLESVDAVARLDLITARALLARAQDAVEPRLNTDGVIDLRAARHPLLGANAVPIDLALGEDEHTTLVITGPNTGGKTVTLKTLGLFTLMAQSGLHVPADPGSTLAIFTQVFVDIGDEQSIEQSLSTFSSHMTNIVRIVKEAGPKALVLMDEIGAGTDPAEGAALAKAVLRELQERGCRTVVTTHYGELKVFAQNAPGFLNASVEFDRETLMPTYRVIAGLPGSSNAFYIAQRLGLPKSLVAHARDLMGSAPLEMEQVLKQAEGVRRALDRERTAAVHARREAEQTATRLQHELTALEEKREKNVSKARREAQDVLQKARQEVNSLLDELKIALREARGTAGDKPQHATLRKRAAATLGAATDRVDDALPAAEVAPAPAAPTLTHVTAGQSVYVRTLGHKGIVLADGHGNDEVEVQVGIMRVRAAVSELESTAPPGDHARPLPPAPAPVRPVDPELHLIGLRAEEAAEKLDEYLYDAADLGLTSVRIVHGFGTGALRATVQDILRAHPVVRASRPGERYEGGGGVTIAQIGGAQ
jgi:DNA mismatch repair protein MutS2